MTADAKGTFISPETYFQYLIDKDDYLGFAQFVSVKFKFFQTLTIVSLQFNLIDCSLRPGGAL